MSLPTRYLSIGSTLTTSNQDVYTAPAAFHSNVSSILFVNTTGSALTVSLDWYDTAYHTIAEALSIPANSHTQIVDALFLQGTNKIRALASGSGVELTLRVEEIARQGI
tara:strand:- start:861 stop:1187 length:327 start_codon:yes stop_codon:yes gene_type:complete